MDIHQIESKQRLDGRQNVFSRCRVVRSSKHQQSIIVRKESGQLLFAFDADRPLWIDAQFEFHDRSVFAESMAKFQEGQFFLAFDIHFNNEDNIFNSGFTQGFIPDLDFQFAPRRCSD